MRGGQTVTAEAPLDRIPIYAKAGSIIPFGPAVQSASAKADPIDIRIYPGADGDFTLYEDEGDNYDYEHGAYSVIPLHWDDKASTLTVGERREASRECWSIGRFGLSARGSQMELASQLPRSSIRLLSSRERPYAYMMTAACDRTLSYGDRREES